MRGLFSGLMALAFAWVVFSRYDDEIGTEVSESERQKYSRNLTPRILNRHHNPWYLLLRLLRCS
mgnify:CR=1 FL=1